MSTGARSVAAGDSVLDRLVSVLQEYSVGGTVDVGQVASKAVVRTVDSEASLVPLNMTNGMVRAGEVSREAWSEGLAYYRVTSLDAPAGRELALRLRDDMSNCVSGAVVDLRDAGGDSADAVVAVASCVVPPGIELFRLRHQRSHAVTSCASASNVTQVAMPLMLIVNSMTSDAAEILVRTLKGRKGVMLVGGSTRGRACLREWVLVTSNLCVRLVTQVAESPMPDVAWTGAAMPDVVSPRGASDSIAVAEVPTKDDPDKPLSARAKADRELMRRVSGDPALGRAVDVLLGLRILTYASGSTNASAGSAGL